jgi:DNA-directed RNA polymerase subunit L
MNPKIAPQSISEEDNILKFTLQGVNTSIANALRRTILSEIDCVVFKTYNEQVNQCTIDVNTTMFNNEIIKQRLGCVPVHIDDLEMPLENYLLELSVENMTDSVQYVTTEDFQIKNLVTDKYLSENDRQKIFPPCDETGYYIDFLRLKPKISDEIGGESIKLNCKFSIGNAKENGMFNVVSCCSYGCSVDDVQQELQLNKMRKNWKDQGLKVSDIKYESDNWKLLDGMRIIKPDSFDFIIQTIGVFTNQNIVTMGCETIIRNLNSVDTMIKKEKLEIVKSKTTMKNSYDIILENDDYTIGKIVEYALYTKFYEGEGNKLTYCGFSKLHPHDTHSIVRLAYENPVDNISIYGDLKVCLQELTQVYTKIKDMF